MIIALKIALILIMVISFFGVIGETSKDSKNTLAAVCIAAIFAAVIAFMYL